MPEYFIVAKSFAAPFFSDTSTSFVVGETPEEAMRLFVKDYSHPAGLYAANLYASSDDYHKNKKALCRWESNHVIEQRKATEGKSGYSVYGHGPGDFEIDGKRHTIPNPKEGRIFMGD